jgi:hypothetical protein
MALQKPSLPSKFRKAEQTGPKLNGFVIELSKRFRLPASSYSYCAVRTKELQTATG